MIRPTTPADIGPQVALAEATGIFKPHEIVALREVLEDFHKIHYADNHQAVTLEEDGEILGFAYYGPVALAIGTWQLWWIAVRKDLHGKGIGGRLLEFVENDIRERQRGRLLFIETGSLPHYDPTRRFYLRHGYEQHALLKDFYAVGDSMVVFRKEL
jgi:GNAT superfamily N-acetyltransferase